MYGFSVLDIARSFVDFLILTSTANIRSRSIASPPLPRKHSSRIFRTRNEREGEDRRLPDRRRPARSTSAAPPTVRVSAVSAAIVSDRFLHTDANSRTRISSGAEADASLYTARQNVFYVVQGGARKTTIDSREEVPRGSEIDQGRFADVRWEGNKKYAFQKRTKKKSHTRSVYKIYFIVKKHGQRSPLREVTDVNRPCNQPERLRWI